MTEGELYKKIQRVIEGKFDKLEEAVGAHMVLDEAKKEFPEVQYWKPMEPKAGFLGTYTGWEPVNGEGENVVMFYDPAEVHKWRKKWLGTTE